MAILAKAMKRYLISNNNVTKIHLVNLVHGNLWKRICTTMMKDLLKKNSRDSLPEDPIEESTTPLFYKFSHRTSIVWQNVLLLLYESFANMAFNISHTCFLKLNQIYQITNLLESNWNITNKFRVSGVKWALPRP